MKNKKNVKKGEKRTNTATHSALNEENREKKKST